MQLLKMLLLFLMAILCLNSCKSSDIQSFPKVGPIFFHSGQCLFMKEVSRFPIRYDYEKDANGKPVYHSGADCPTVFYALPIEDVSNIQVWEKTVTPE